MVGAGITYATPKAVTSGLSTLSSRRWPRGSERRGCIKAAEETEEIIEAFKALEAVMARALDHEDNALRDMWRAVEWADSGDYMPEDILKEYEGDYLKARAKRDPPALSRCNECGEVIDEPPHEGDGCSCPWRMKGTKDERD